MWMTLLHTANDRTLFMVRLVLGTVMFAHGAQKALGWFGGSGLSPTLNYFAQTLGIPAPLAVLAIAAEFLGGAGLLFGLLGRVGAFGIAVNMIVAALLVHLPYGFFMNWFGAKAGEGVEYHLLALALAALIVVRGSGAWSLDRLVIQKLGSGRPGETRTDGFRTFSGTKRPVVAVPRVMRGAWMWVTAQRQVRW